MKNISKNIFISVLSAAILASCVPAKQFNDLRARQENCEKTLSSLKSENQKFGVENTELKAKIARLERQVETLLKDSVDRSFTTLKLKSDYNKMQKRYDDLKKAQQSLLEGSSEETTRLLRQLQQTQDDLQKKEDALSGIERSLNEKKRNLEMLKGELDERNKRLLELERILAQKDAAVKQLKNTVSNALTGFENKGLTVEIRNGKVYVSLEEKLLFSSGSTAVDANGRQALRKLSTVLEQNKDIHVMVEGHTDDVPVIPSEAMKDNWDLSVKRAAEVVRILLEGSAINPKRITASGRGEFLPVENAKTESSRRKNRRTEIILTPKLDELFQILETQ